jgi:hypothetical protein
MSIMDYGILASVSKFRIVLTACQAFIGSDKLSILVTNLSNHTSLLQGGFMEGGWGSQDDGRAELLLGTKTSSRVQGPAFDLVGTSWKVVVRDAGEGARTMCCQVSHL